jgi:tetratricopeptide (TPR) repeat protein
MCSNCLELTRRSLLVGGGVAAAALHTGVAEARVRPADMVPLVGPGFKPTDKDEQGLWREMERVEEEIADSNLLITDPNLTGYLQNLIGTVGGPAAKDFRIYLANRGIGYVWKQDFAAAEKDLNAAAAINPDNPVVLRARGLMAERKGEWTKAIDLYTRSLSRDSGDVFAIQHRATCESALAKYDEALADSALALKGNPSSVEMRLLRANIFLLQGNSDAVAQEAKVLVEQERASDYALVAAARIYAKIGRNADALKAFDAALAIKPLPYIYVNRAQSRPFTDHSGRLADLDAALKLDPNDPDALAEKAEEVGSTGDYQQALQLYDRVMKANPKASYYNVRRAIMLYKSGHAAEAKKLLDEQRVKANAANDFNSLCWAKATAGILLEEALEDCRQALKLAPEIGTYIDSLALVELRLGRVDDAIADYDRAIARKSGAASYMGRAIAYAWKGDKAHADLDLAQALKLDSDERTRFEEFGLKLDRPSQPAKKD